MKPLNEFNNEDKIKLLFQLFPGYIQKAKDITIHCNEAVQKMKEKDWNNGFMTLDYWKECAKLATRTMLSSKNTPLQISNFLCQDLGQIFFCSLVVAPKSLEQWCDKEKDSKFIQACNLLFE